MRYNRMTHKTLCADSRGFQCSFLKESESLDQYLVAGLEANVWTFLCILTYFEGPKYLYSILARVIQGTGILLSACWKFV